MITRNFSRPSLVAAIATTLVLAGAVGSLAGEEGTAEMGHPGMGEPAVMEEGMMAMHQEMHAKMQAMDQKLDALVVEMNSAGPDSQRLPHSISTRTGSRSSSPPTSSTSATS